MFLQLVLTCQKKIQYNRSISSIYYLLKGKQSIQTIQDARLFNLSPFYGVYKNLSKERFLCLVKELIIEGFLIEGTTSNHYYLTEKAKCWLEENEIKSSFLFGSRYRMYDQIYFSRLLLLIQVWTNSKMKHNTYIPIIENNAVENWVKSYYRITKKRMNEFLHLLYEELFTVLSQLSIRHAEIVVDQITSYKTIGLTAHQIAVNRGLSIDDIYLVTTEAIHYILEEVQKDKNKYSLLYSIGKDLFPTDTMTLSAEKTNQLLKKGLKVKEIAKMRQLKLNTIYDHLVEIALHNEEFNLSIYVSEREQAEIVQAIESLSSYKLKDIKEAVDDRISYFQIRLVLARLNEIKNGCESEYARRYFT